MSVNRQAFAAAFAASLDMLRNAESTTKHELRELSRSVLSALHDGDAELYGDIQFVNALMGVVTPVNRKVLVLYFKEFTGFMYDDASKVFTKKNKKTAAEAKDKAMEFLAEPGNNVWTWAERNVEIEAKPFDPRAITRFIDNAIKKMDGDKVGVLRAVLAGGITTGDLVQMMDEIAKIEQAKAAAPAVDVAAAAKEANKPALI